MFKLRLDPSINEMKTEGKLATATQDGEVSEDAICRRERGAPGRERRGRGRRQCFNLLRLCRHGGPDRQAETAGL